MFTRPDFLALVFVETLQAGFHPYPSSLMPLGADMNSSFRGLAVVWAGSAVRGLLTTVYTVIPIAPDSWQFARW